jgi:ABC-type branched-subunit amino acid transport system ATPase component
VSPLLEISGICKNFGGVIALDGVDLSVETGSLTCIIGPNGCGKTTLFNVVSGAFRPTAGRVRYAGDDITGLPPFRVARKGISRKFQVPGIYPSLSVT